MMRWKNGDWIEGDFENDKLKEGRGRRTVEGEVKEGVWLGDVLTGRFEGHWSPDEPYSKGITRYINERAGEVYEGERLDYKRHGQGTRVLADGEKWEGEWKDGQFHRGRLTEFDGCYYEGTFERGKLQGEGKYVSTTQHYIEEGMFEDANLIQGKRTWHDGDVYEGAFTTLPDERDPTQTCTTYHGFGVRTNKADGLFRRYEGMTLVRVEGWL
jgi:hypothetical protein